MKSLKLQTVTWYRVVSTKQNRVSEYDYINRISHVVSGVYRQTRVSIVTGYNQSVTGCGSQRKQFSCYSTKTNVNSNLV